MEQGDNGSRSVLNIITMFIHPIKKPAGTSKIQILQKIYVFPGMRGKMPAEHGVFLKFPIKGRKIYYEDIHAPAAYNYLPHGEGN